MAAAAIHYSAKNDHKNDQVTEWSVLLKGWTHPAGFASFSLHSILVGIVLRFAPALCIGR